MLKGRSRSNVMTMLQKRADNDRQILIFPRPFRSDATPYPKLQFSPEVSQACSASQRPLMAGLRIAKAIFLGDVAVGKTSLVNRFCHHHFDKNYKATIGVDFEVERFDILQVPYNLQIWDTAGQERFKCIAASYYRAAHAVVVVFDLTSYMSLSHCSQWLEEAMTVNTEKPHVFIVGTKKDLLSSSAYQAVEERAVRVARQLRAEFWAVSAKSGDFVQDFFFRLASLTFDASVQRERETSSSSMQTLGSGLVTLERQPRKSSKYQRSSNCLTCN